MEKALLAETLQTVVALRRSLDRLSKMLELAEQGRYLAIAPLLKRDVGLFADARQQADRLAGIDDKSVVSALNQRLAESKLTYQRDLEEEFHRRGWHVGGQWPNYLLNGVLPVKVDLKRHRLAIGVRQLPSLDLLTATEVIQQATERLLNRPFDKDNFLMTVRRAFEETGEALKLPEGQFAPITEVQKRIADPKEYSAEAFGIDLFKLLRALPPPRPIELSPARSPRGAIFVPLSTGGGFVSGIRLTERLAKAARHD